VGIITSNKSEFIYKNIIYSMIRYLCIKPCRRHYTSKETV